MSGTETILLIVLGFSLASLIGLFVGRLIWTTALKLGARRMQRQMPSSLVGLQTERDRLRAEYAMMAQRLGSRLEEAKLRLAENMAEVSRHRNRLQQIERSEGARNAEIAQLRARVAELEGALSDSQTQETELRQALAAKEEAFRKLRKKRGYEGHKFAEEPLPAAPPVDPEIRLRQRIDKLSEMARARPSDEPVFTEEISEKLAEAERQTRDLETELQNLESTWPTPSDNIIHLPNRPRDLKSGTSSSS
jgi:DNA repair exonuclease SbcCD ATPase subunit